MKRLFRGDAPLCLAKCKNRQDKNRQDDWSVISNNGLTDEIWKALKIMQSGFCAYCECQLQEDNNKRHIEHFIQRNRDRSKIFDWDNLFGSCNNPNRCGKFKDEDSRAKNIDLAKVCKPDVMDASKLILFLNSGEVRSRTTLTPEQKEIADNTIAVFNLDGDNALKNSRKAVIAGEKKLADEYWEMLADVDKLAGDDKDDYTKLLEGERQEALERIKASPHSTALKHLWVLNEKF